VTRNKRAKPRGKHSAVSRPKVGPKSKRKEPKRRVARSSIPWPVPAGWCSWSSCSWPRAIDLGLQLHPLQRPQPARRAAGLLPTEGGVCPREARHRDHPQHDSVRLAARRTAAAHRPAGQGLRRPHFIAVHLSKLPYGGVYSKINAAALPNPTNAKLRALEQASFQEQRSAGCCSKRVPSQRSARSCSGGAIASFCLALIMAILVGLGFLARSPDPNRSRNVADKRD
jgi:hypothetical protein